MKKTILKAALFAYINTICFRNFRPSCTNISQTYNRNIVCDSKCSVISHDKLQRLLQIERKWNLFLLQKYGHLIKKNSSFNSNKQTGVKTFIIIDDTVIAKPFSKELDILSWLYSSGDARYLYGLNIVFVIWTDGNTRFPIGFRLWKKDGKKSRIDLAMEILKEAKKSHKIKPDYVLMDSFYAAAKLLRLIRKLKWHWIAKLKSNRLINNIQAKDAFTYRYGNKIGKLSEGIKVLVIKDNNNFWASSKLDLTSLHVKELYRKRQIIEEFFKILKSELRIEGCASRNQTAQINHIFLVLIAFCQLEDFRIKKNISTIYKLRMIFFDCIIPSNLKWSIVLPKLNFA
jgi:putative transposase